MAPSSAFSGVSQCRSMSPDSSPGGLGDGRGGLAAFRSTSRKRFPGTGDLGSTFGSSLGSSGRLEGGLGDTLASTNSGGTGGCASPSFARDTTPSRFAVAGLAATPPLGSRHQSPVGHDSSARGSLAKHLAERQQQRQSEWDHEITKWKSLADAAGSQANNIRTDYRTDARLANCERELDRLFRDLTPLKSTVPRHEDRLGALEQRLAAHERRASEAERRQRSESPAGIRLAEEFLNPLRTEVAGLRGLVAECRNNIDDRCKDVLANVDQRLAQAVGVTEEQRSDLWQAYIASMNERMQELEKALEERCSGNSVGADVITAATRAALEQSDDRILQLETAFSQLCSSADATRTALEQPDDRIVQLEKAISQCSSAEATQAALEQSNDRISKIESTLQNILSEQAANTNTMNTLVAQLQQTVKERRASDDPSQSLVQKRVEDLEQRLRGQPITGDHASLKPLVDDLSKGLSVAARNLQRCQQDNASLVARVSALEQCGASAGTVGEQSIHLVGARVEALEGSGAKTSRALEDNARSVERIEALAGALEAKGAMLEARLDGLEKHVQAAADAIRASPAKERTVAIPAVPEVAEKISSGIQQADALCMSAPAGGGEVVPAQVVAKPCSRVERVDTLCGSALAGGGETVPTQLLSKLCTSVERADALCRSALAGGDETLPKEVVSKLCTSVERVDALCRRALEGGNDTTLAPKLGARMYEGVERVEALCQRALHGTAEKSATLQVVSQMCGKIDNLGALCQSALEGRLEPSELSQEICGSVVRLDAFCERALTGSGDGGTNLDELDAQCLRAADGNPEQSQLAAKFCGKLQALDDLCEKALQVESPRLCGRVQTPLDPISEIPGPLPQSAGTLDEVTSSPLGNTCTTAATATSPDVGAEELVPRVASLVTQLYGITPRLLDLSEDFDTLAATQGDQSKQIEILCGHLVATQDELASLKHRLRSWMDTIRQLHTLQRGGHLRAASAPPRGGLAAISS